MVNYLLVSNRLYTAQNLINDISKNISQIRLYNVSTSINNALDIINENSNFIDIIILNLSLNDSLLFLDLLKNKYSKKYSNSIIIINNNKFIFSKDYDSLLYKSTEGNYIDNIINLVKIKKKEHSISKNKLIIITYLEKLGYNFTHIGTQYLLDILMFLLTNNIYKCPNLNNTIYPIIAKKYKTNVNNVKCVITKATKYMNEHLKVNKEEQYLSDFIDNYFNTKAVINLLLIKMNNHK